MVQAVNDELTELMGGSGRELAFSSSGPTVILIAGLQGSGKTTATAKLGKLLAKDNRNVALAACDLQRPAAVEQLQRLGEQAKLQVYARPGRRTRSRSPNGRWGRRRRRGATSSSSTPPAACTSTRS